MGQVYQLTGGNFIMRIYWEVDGYSGSSLVKSCADMSEARAHFDYYYAPYGYKLKNITAY